MIQPEAPPGGDKKSAPELEIRLFGPMEVRVGGQPMQRLRSRKGLWILALLALRGGRQVDREWLAGSLWPDCEESDARRSLRQSLHDLRRAMGPAGARLHSQGRHLVRFDLTGAVLDVAAFDAAVAKDDEASLEAGVRWRRGPLLEGCAEEWAIEERRVRDERFVAAVQSLALAAAGRGDRKAQVSWLACALAEEPYREDLQRMLMEALAAVGDASSALASYHAFRGRLRREMAAEPEPLTVALFQRIRGEIRARRAASVNSASPPSISRGLGNHALRLLPNPLTDLIGREDDVRDVAALLANARLVTLVGSGGVGKTRLALQVAAESCDDYDEGAAFVQLAALTEPSTIPDAVRDALGIPAGDGRKDTTELLAQTLSDLSVLIVLDNCEHLLAATADFAERLLSQCSGLRIVATSRQPLGIPGECVWRVPSLSVPPPRERDYQFTAGTASMGAAKGLDEYDSVRLFVQRARDMGRRWQASGADLVVVGEVCRQLDGIPLAIELAAARTRSLSVSQIHSRLRDRFDLLTLGSRSVPNRQQTLRAAMDWSYELLDNSERALLRRLAVFAGGWTLDAAEHVCAMCAGCDSKGQIDVLNVLDQLVERSLVAAETGGSDARYSLLETVRQYAWERLEESGELQAARKAHAAYFLSLAEEANPELTGAESTAWIERLDLEHDNLRASLATLRENRDGCDHGMRLAAALWRFWEVRGYLREGRAQLSSVLSQEHGQEWTTARAEVLNGAGNLAWSQGDYDLAGCLHEESLAIWRKLGDGRGIAHSLSNLGNLACCQPDYAKARLLFEEGLAMRRELGDRRGIAASLHDLGIVAHNLGDHTQARSLFVEALSIFREVGDRAYMANLLANLGNLSSLQGDYSAARASLSECLQIIRELGNKPLACYALELRAGLALAENWLQCAGQLWGSAEALREAIGAPLPPHGQTAQESLIAEARNAAGNEAFAAAWAEGRAMTMEQALDYVLVAADAT